jgi:hypothetical protein
MKNSEFKIHKINDVWLDNGLATFSKILKRLNDDEENIIEKIDINPFNMGYSFNNRHESTKSLSNVIEGKIEDMIVEVENKNTGEIKEVKKDHILIQEKKKIHGKVAFKEDLFDKNKTENIIRTIYENLEEGDKTCFFCGRKFKSKFKKLQQASYPFVTKIKSLSGIRSYTEKGVRLTEYIANYCPQCYFIGILEWLDDSMIYRTIPGEKSIIILPQMERLNELIKLKNSYPGILNNTKRWSNIKIDIDKEDVENPPEKYATLVSFYENLIRHINPDKHANHWLIIEIPAGSVKNPKYYEILFRENSLNLFYELIKKEDCLFYRGFVKIFYAFYNDPKKGTRDFDREKVLREQLCQAVTENNFILFCNAFLPRKGVHIGITKEAYKTLGKIIKIWRFKKMDKNAEDFLETVKSAGNSISSLIGNRVSLFFKLEKAKKPSDLLKVLQEITRRLIIDKDKFETNYEKFKRLPESEKRKIQYINTYNLDKVIETITESQENKKLFEDTKNIMLIYASLRRKTKEVTNEQ